MFDMGQRRTAVQLVQALEHLDRAAHITLRLVCQLEERVLANRMHVSNDWWALSDGRKSGR